MNTTNISQFRIPVYDDAWHRFRGIGLTQEDCMKYKCDPYAGGIGASEIGNLLGLVKKYRPCPAEIYHFKVGGSSPSQNTNRAMMRGKILEPVVKTIWELFNGEDDEWVKVYEEYQNGGRETRDRLSIRKASKRNAYFVNTEYPFLFSSLDYYSEKNTPGLLDGKVHNEGFPVEIKTVNQNYAKLWESECPPSHVCQLNQEMICTNSEYGEIAVLFPDDFSFRVFPFYRDDALCKRIISYGKEWWDKVLEAREAKKNMDRYYKEGKMELGEEQQAIIDSNEPDPDDSEAYLAYIKERYKPGAISEVEGDISLYYDTLEYKLAGEVEKLLDSKQTGIKNQVLKILESTGAESIKFGDLGKITYNEDKNGKRTLRFDTKSIIPLKDRAELEYNKIDFNLK